MPLLSCEGEADSGRWVACGRSLRCTKLTVGLVWEIFLNDRSLPKAGNTCARLCVLVMGLSHPKGATGVSPSGDESDTSLGCVGVTPRPR